MQGNQTSELAKGETPGAVETEQYGYAKFGEGWTYPDAKYQRKNVGKYTVELIYGTERGGMIRVWTKATDDERASAQKLPHIYCVSKGMYLWAEASFWENENARCEYRALTTSKAVWSLIVRSK